MRSSFKHLVVFSIIAGLALVAVSSFNYAKQKRLVVSLGLVPGLGSLLAAFPVVCTTKGKIKVPEYQGYFALGWPPGPLEPGPLFCFVGPVAGVWRDRGHPVHFWLPWILMDCMI